MPAAKTIDIERVCACAAEGLSADATAERLGIAKSTMMRAVERAGLSWVALKKGAETPVDAPQEPRRASAREHRGLTWQELCDEHDRQEDEIRDLRDELLDALRENGRLRRIAEAE